MNLSRWTTNVSAAGTLSDSAGPAARWALLLVLVALAVPAHAQDEWQPAGPAPVNDGQTLNVVPNDEVVGAIHTVVAHPTDANILWIGAVNGGIWKTTNATAAQPTWVRQTDAQQSLSIGALELDPDDPGHQTLLAGIGRFSSLARIGGERTGLLRTTNGGTTWTSITGGGTLLGKNISGVAARGNTLVIAVNTADNPIYDNIGVFRSTDGGATFTQVSIGNGSTTGLPGGEVYDLVGDPNDSNRLFTGGV